MRPGDRDFFKISELSLLLERPVQTLHSWLKAGKIRGCRRTSRSGTFLVPRSEVARLLEAAGREVPGLWVKERVRVLLIDDDPLLRELGTAAARAPAFPMTLEAAATLEDGLLLAPALQPDVILLGSSFPKDQLQGELGLAFIRHAKKTRTAKVVAMVDTGREAARMRAAGADEVLNKPFGLAELRSAIYRQWRSSTASAGASSGRPSPRGTSRSSGAPR